MLIVSPSIHRKIVGLESSVKTRDIVFLETNLAADEGPRVSSYSINKLSDKVCASPSSAGNNALSIFPINSNDLHKAV